MGLPFGLRFDFRNPTVAGTALADRYAAGLDMVEWADRLGCTSVAVSEHHGSEDGYVPSPLPMVAAMVARTSHVRFLVAALIAPFYDPLRLAEDLLVLDHLGRGRVDVIVGAGYVRSEFDLYGVDLKERVHRVSEVVRTLKAAFTGDPFDYRGRTVRLTPAPFRSAGPRVLLGGSSEPAARRAARIADGFIPAVPEVWPYYRDEMQLLGLPDPGPCPIGEQHTIALAEDPDRAWDRMAPFFLHETNAYGRWLEDNGVAGPYRPADGVDQLRTQGRYRILTPDEYLEELKAAPFPFAMFEPLAGGMPPDLAWSSLRLFERAVLPAFA